MAHTPGLAAKNGRWSHCGNAVPEANQGMQMGRMLLLALGIDNPGFNPFNRYADLGLEAIALAVVKSKLEWPIASLAGGNRVHCLWCQMMGYKTAFELEDRKRSSFLINPQQWDWQRRNWQRKWNHKRTSRCIFCKVSWENALSSQSQLGKFKDENRTCRSRRNLVEKKEEKDTEIHCWYRWRDLGRATKRMEALGGIRTQLSRMVSGLTAGTSSQTSDGASFVVSCPERMV